MRVLRIALTEVRGIGSCEVRLAREGVTVIEAPNEAGKTTLFDAVDVLLGFPDSSRHRRVRSLQPAGRDVGSTVEVELIAGATHLTCRKTFNRRTATELIVHAPVAQQLTGGEAHDRLTAILAEEADLDLAGALRFQQGRELTAIALHDSRVLASRLDAIAGGDGTAAEDDALLTRAAAELDRYLTPTGRERALLTDADARVQELEQEHAELRRRLLELEAASDELAGIDLELPTLRERLAHQLAPRLTELERRLTAVDRLTAVVDARRAELAAAEAGHERAAREHEQRQQEVAALVDLTAELDDRRGRLEPDRAWLGELTDTLAEREAELTSAAAAAAASSRQLDLARTHLELLHARAEHTALTRRLEQAGSLLAASDRLGAELAATRVDADRVAEIRTADQAARVAEATLRAGSPVVEITAMRELTAEVDGRRVVVAPDPQPASFAVGDQLRLEVPDTVLVEVRAGGSTGELQRARDEAVAELQRRCREVGVADLAEAEQRARERAELERARTQTAGDLSRVLDGWSLAELELAVDGARTRVAALAAELPPEDEGRSTDPDAAREAVTALRGELERAEVATGEHRAGAEALRADLAALTARLAGEQATVEGLEAHRDRASEALALARAGADDGTLAERVVAAREQLVTQQHALSRAEQELAELDPDDVRLQLEALQEARSRAQERLSELSERRAALRERLELAGAEGLGERGQQLAQELQRAQADQRRLRARADAARALHEALTTAREEVVRAYRAPLVERIVRLAELLYGRRGGVGIEVDDELAIVARTLDGTTLTWEQLSAGAREQLAILSALAAAQLAAADGVPLVLDDMLGYSDPSRLERLGALLGRTTDAQIIVLTCVADRFQHVRNAATVRLVEHTATTGS